MFTDVLDHHDILPAADHANIFNVLTGLEGDKARPDANSLLVNLHLVVVLLAEIVLVPLELLEQEEAPALLHVNHSLNFLEDGVEFLEDLFEGEYVVGFLGVLLP